MKFELEKQIIEHKKQLSSLELDFDGYDREEIEKLQKIIQEKEAELKEFSVENIEQDISTIDSNSNVSQEVKDEIKANLNITEGEKEIASEAIFVENEINETRENQEDPLTERYNKEILPIIEILKPDGVSLDEYEDQVADDLFESVKKIQTAQGRLSEDPEKTLEEVKDLLNSRIKSALATARNWQTKDTVDPDFVKKSKIALLAEGDLTDYKESHRRDDDHMGSIRDLRDYVVAYGDKNKFTESDIDSLMKTKYKKIITDSDLSSYIGSYGTCETIPKSLLVGLAQSKENNRSYPIGYALETAENEKYDNECLEQILASDLEKNKYAKIVITNIEKFQGKPIDKVLTSGFSEGNEIISYLINSGLPDNELNAHIENMVRNNVCHDLRQSRGLYNNKNHEVVKIFSSEIEELHEVEMDTHDEQKVKNEEVIKKFVQQGHVGLALATSVCKKYVKNYSETDYENFIKYIGQYDQEHLVFDYLKDEDRLSYANKLIDKGEEYKIVRFIKLLPEHFLDSTVFNKLKDKNLVPNLKGNLAQFKDLPPDEALEFIRNDETDTFTNNIESFAVTEEFLKTPEIQEACLKEFNKELQDTVNRYKARNIYDKIPFPEGVADQAIQDEINRRLFTNYRIEWACSTIQNFPHIKKYLETPEIQKRVHDSLLSALYNGYGSNALNILECFPLPQSDLSSEEVRGLCKELIERKEKTLAVSTSYDTKKGVEEYFETINGISKYIEIPEYVKQQQEKINIVYATEDERLMYIKDESVKRIIVSKKPVETYNNIVNLMDEVKDCKRIDSRSEFLAAYVEKFEGKGTQEEKDRFINYVENITKSISDYVLINNFDYLYDNFSGLPEDELLRHKDLLSRYVLASKESRLDESHLIRDAKFQDIFERLLSYTPEQQNEMLNIIKIGTGTNDFPDKFDEGSWATSTLEYLNDSEEMNKISRNESRKAKVLEEFNGSYKDVALSMMSKEWQSFLNSDSKFLPPNIFYISKFIDEAGGAGNLKHVESLGNLIYQTDKVLEAPKTVDRTKTEIKNLLSAQEVRFDKEKWSQDDRSEFYNLSNDIIQAAPSLYTAFSPVFEKMSPKEMKSFMKEVFPFYQAQLVIIQEISGDDVKYNPKDLVNVRQSLRNIAKEIEGASDEKTEVFNDEKDRLIEVVKDGFKERFGLIKVPNKFEKEDLRSIQNTVRYIGNISDRNTGRETLIAFYLGLKLNGQWDSFRQGKEIKLDEYFSGTKLELIKPLVEEKMKGYELLAETAGITKDQMPRFQEILQEDTISNMMGNIQTVDVKLGNIKRNVEELADPDIYENGLDKEIIKLLTKEGRSVGAVLAKTFSEVSGKPVVMSDDEKIIQSKIADVFGVNNWSAEQVKKIQDRISPLSLVSNMVNKMNEEKVDENIAELQKRLIPTIKIIEIFNRLGEEFKQESGAMAISKDLTYLESLMVKDDKKLTSEEKIEVTKYLDSIKEKMKDLEGTMDKVKEYFDKIKKSAHLENQPLLKDRLTEIEKVIYSTDSNAMIVSHMTKDLNLIIENMRQCLGCMRKEANNDTNLAFGDYNKFFMMNQSEKDKGSISDEIVFFAPVKTPDGKEEVSFILDKVYGSKSADILIGNILSIRKKYDALKKEMPDANISISVSDAAMSSVGLDAEILKNRLAELIPNMKYVEPVENLIANIPKSAFSDNYIEFSSDGARKSGERVFGGLVLR